MVIKAVIFDVGGVLIQIPNRMYYKYLHDRSGLGTDVVEKTIRRSLPPVESGKMSVNKFIGILSGKLGIARSELDWLRPLRDGAEVDIDMIEMAQLLRKNYTVAYLSNVDRARFYYARRILGGEPFDYRFASCYIGMVKPDRRIYSYVLNEMELEPEEVVFIDNEPDNVAGAASLGIHAVHFTSRRELDKSLYRLKLNI